MIEHSLILAYRDRPAHLATFLECLRHVEPSRFGWELVLVDLGAKKAEVHPELPIQHHHFPTDGAFPKSKALNFAVKAAKGFIVTILDVDMLLQPNFLKAVQDWWSNEPRPSQRGCFDVRRLDQHSTKCALDFGWNHIKAAILDKPERHASKWTVTFQRQQTGNSQITMLRDDYLDAGGMNERFVGYGLEDVEFNLRCTRLWGETAIVPGTTMFHLWHPTLRDGGRWRDPILEGKNAGLFNELSKAGFPRPEQEQTGVLA